MTAEHRDRLAPPLTATENKLNCVNTIVEIVIVTRTRNYRRERGVNDKSATIKRSGKKMEIISFLYMDT